MDATTGSTSEEYRFYLEPPKIALTYIKNGAEVPPYYEDYTLPEIAYYEETLQIFQLQFYKNDGTDTPWILSGIRVTETDNPSVTLTVTSGNAEEVGSYWQFTAGNKPLTIELLWDKQSISNPSFEVISPLLSRCQVYVLKSLEKKDLELLVDRAIEKDVYLREKPIVVREKDALISFSGGDARKLLNILELVVNAQSGSEIVIDNETVRKELQENPLMYDKDGEQHYDIISAMIKSIRGSDPNAALYYMARMLEGGEDPKFIARRLLISASEDIGLANPNAMLLANACFDIVHKIGMPEARIPLSECVIYLATSPKSNSAYLAIDGALALVRKTGNVQVPLYLRNAPTKLMKELNYGKDYKYAHDYPGHFVDMEYMPQELKDAVFYEPQDNAAEAKIAERLRNWWNKYRDNIKR